MRSRTVLLVVHLVAAVLLSCHQDKEKLVEVGRWVDDNAFTLFIIYHMPNDIPEEELKVLLKPISRMHSAQYEFVVQLAVHELAWAQKLASAEIRERIEKMELFVGADLLEDPSLTTNGGMVYTYYKNGDYDEWMYSEAY